LLGLIVEGAVIGLVVTLLPKVPLGKTTADTRPSLAPPDPASVERRLDAAARQLLQRLSEWAEATFKPQH
jgi:hypothetical protein